MAERININQDLDNAVQKQELPALVNLFAIYLPNPGSLGSWFNRPTYTFTPDAETRTNVFFQTYNAMDPIEEQQQAYQEGLREGTQTIFRNNRFSFEFYIDNQLYNFQGIPMEIEGLEYTAEASMPRPTITIGNIKNLGFDPESLLGAKLRYIQTFERYERGEQSLPPQTFIIDAIKEETFAYLQFELVAPYDVEGIKLPGRRIVGGQCPWVYKGASGSNSDRTQNFIVTDTPRGGCTWPADNVWNTLGTKSLIFMNSNDEYVVDSRLVPLATSSFAAKPEDVSIEEGRYYYTTATTYKLNSLGEKETNLSTVKRYWQALATVSPAAGIDDPSPSSNQWREVRVYKPYTYDQIFNAYDDPRFNDYVSIPQGGTLQYNYLAGRGLSAAYEFVNPESINEIVGLDDFEEVIDDTGGKALRLPVAENSSLQNLADYVFSVEQAYDPDSIRVNINTRAGTALDTFAEQPSADQTWLPISNLSSNGTFYATNKSLPGWGLTEGQALFILEPTAAGGGYNTDNGRAGTKYSLWLGLGVNTTAATDGKSAFISPIGEILKLWIHTQSVNTVKSVQIYQVKNKTLDPDKMDRLEHGPFPPLDFLNFNFKNWTAGDQCSKSLNACVKRFQASPVNTEKLKEGEEIAQGNSFTWHMTPRYSGPDRNIYYMKFPRFGESDQYITYSLGDYFMVKYLKCTDTALFDSLPDEGFVDIDMYVDGQYRKDYPFKGDTGESGTDNFYTDLGIYTGTRNTLGGVQPYHFPQTIEQYKGAAGFGLGLPLRDRYYYIKLPASRVNGQLQPGLATGGALTPSGRLPGFHSVASLRYNSANIHHDRHKAFLETYFSSSSNVTAWNNTWFSTPPVDDSDPGTLKSSVFFDENVGATNGLIIFPESYGYNSVLNTVDISQALNPQAAFANAPTTQVTPEEAPHIIDLYGNKTEIGFNAGGFSGQNDGEKIPNGPFSETLSGGAGAGNTNSVISDDDIDSFIKPLLKTSAGSTITDGTTDPETQELYRLQFAVFQDSNTQTLSATLNSNVALPFGGFPGSRRFK